MSELSEVRAFLLDMDGTFYLSDRLIDGALRFVEVLKAQGKDYLFLTNNSSKSASEYAAKITNLGLPTSVEKILTSGEATARFLKHTFPEARLFVVGTPSLQKELQEFGFTLDEENPQLVVLGFDTTLTYAKLWKLCDLVRNGLPYIATHPDFNCPIEGGYMPDIGAIIAFVKASTGREPDQVIGKPNRYIVEAAVEKLGQPINRLAMIGDRLYTDIALGATSGIRTVLVLSGETRLEDLRDSLYQPTIVFADLGALADYLIEIDTQEHRSPPHVGNNHKLSHIGVTSMNLPYDPADHAQFWEKVRTLPGFPKADSIPLRRMVFESDALYRLPTYLEEIGISPTTPVLVVMDATPMRRGRDSLKPLVIQVLVQSGFETRQLVLTPDSSGQVHTDMPHIETVISHLAPGLAVIALGSGVVTDITKHACYLYAQASGQELPFVVFQTANSVSAYTSNLAPVFIQGVKRTLPSRYPNLLICDLETLVDAPREMTAAGVGDLLAAFTSLADWRLAHVLGMDDSYSELPERIIGPLDQILLEIADELREPTPRGMSVLAKLISLGGLAMSLSHATTPMSGYEHVISHVLDMIQEHRQAPLAHHGSQVALATVIVSQAYQDFLNRFDPNHQLSLPLPSETMRALIEATFRVIDPSGKAGEECWSDYHQKLENWKKQMARWTDFVHGWLEERKTLVRLTRPPELILEIIEKTGGPRCFGDLEPPFASEDVRFAFLNAPLMRKRLTLGDLLIFTNWDRERIWRDVQVLGVV